MGSGPRLEVERNEHFIKLLACKREVSSKLLMENLWPEVRGTNMCNTRNILELNLKKKRRHVSS